LNLSLFIKISYKYRVLLENVENILKKIMPLNLERYSTLLC